MKNTDFAKERRAPADAPNAKAALKAFETADDVFTTCRRCKRVVGAVLDKGVWAYKPHECTDGR